MLAVIEALYKQLQASYRLHFITHHSNPNPPSPQSVFFGSITRIHFYLQVSTHYHQSCTPSSFLFFLFYWLLFRLDRFRVNNAILKLPSLFKHGACSHDRGGETLPWVVLLRKVGLAERLRSNEPQKDVRWLRVGTLAGLARRRAREAG